MFTKKYFRLSRGFTLIELLVVIAIIGVLATLLLLQLGVARGKARDAKRIADINQLRTALELYYDDNGGQYVGHSPILIGDLSTYLTSPTMPKDPLTLNDYYYAWKDSGGKHSKYQIWTELEQKNTSALSADADIDSTAWTGGDKVNGATETCDAYVGGTSKQCVYDQGQN